MKTQQRSRRCICSILVQIVVVILCTARATPVSRCGGTGFGDAGDNLAVEEVGNDVVLRQGGGWNALRDGWAAASFICSLGFLACTSSAPRKMPGQASALLI
ncbi:MAG: hypothetical protein U0231_16335 [Nitrospiraceae bacterium]